MTDRRTFRAVEGYGEPVWFADAACRRPDVETAWFFPGPGESAARGKRICARCPVRRECLLDALDAWTAGVWGGMNARERTAFRRAHPGEDLTRVELPRVKAHRADVLPTKGPKCPVCGEVVDDRRIYCDALCRETAHRRRYHAGTV